MKKLLIVPVIFFLGCGSKDVFVPKNPKEKVLKSQTKNGYLRDYTKKNLTFQTLELKYVKKSSFIDDGVRGEWVYYDENGTKLGKFKKINDDLAVRGDKLLLIKEKKIISLPYMAASASKKGNFIALTFENNAIGIYDLTKNALTFYQENEPVIIAKYLKPSPLFYNDLILFPLLNSKIGVFDLRSNKFIRDIDLADDNVLSNIIFLKIVNNRLFMATPQKIVLFDPNYLIDFQGDIKHIVSIDDNLYLFLVDGKIIKLNSSLKKLKEINLPFADYFAPGVCKGDIYTVTSNRYLVKISKDLNVTVYKGNDFETYNPLKIKNCKIYNSDKVYFIE